MKRLKLVEGLLIASILAIGLCVLLKRDDQGELYVRHVSSAKKLEAALKGATAPSQESALPREAERAAIDGLTARPKK